eukprot:74436_1
MDDFTCTNELHHKAADYCSQSGCKTSYHSKVFMDSFVCKYIKMTWLGLTILRVRDGPPLLHPLPSQCIVFYDRISTHHKKEKHDHWSDGEDVTQCVVYPKECGSDDKAQ